MHLEVEEATEEVQTWFPLGLAAAIGDGFVHEFLRFEHLLVFDVLVDVVPTQRV